MPEIRIETVEDYQAAAASIALKVLNDAKFAEQIRDDPVFTLRSLGLQQDVVRELMTEDRYLRLRYGSQLEDDGCTVTCIATCDGCCVTCWFTDFLYGEPVVRQVFGSPDAAIPVAPEKARLAQTLIERGHLLSPKETRDTSS
jgi:hypothetical protein